MSSKKVLYYYKKFRAHQMATYGNSGLWIDGVDQRQFSGGGAACGFHAVSAYNSARSHVQAVCTLRDTLLDEKAI
jgi:hypothetical protein